MVLNFGFPTTVVRLWALNLPSRYDCEKPPLRQLEGLPQPKPRPGPGMGLLTKGHAPNAA